MKNIIILISLIVLTNTISAQKIISGSLDSIFVREFSTINVKWDCSNLKFGGKFLTLDQFLGDNYSVDEWENIILPNMLTSFLIQINEHTDRHQIIFDQKAQDAPFTMTIKPEKLHRKGDGSVTFSITERKSNKEIVTINQITKGGLFGSIDNLLSETYGRTGKSLGKFINSMMLKTKIKYPEIKRERDINYKFDYSKVKLLSIDAKNYFFTNLSSETDSSDIIPEKDKRIIEDVFISAANEKSLIDKGYKLDNKRQSRLEARIYLIEVGKEGAHSFTAMVVDKIRNKVIGRIAVKVGDGKLNNFQTLFMEQLRETGEEFGDKLADTIFD